MHFWGQDSLEKFLLVCVEDAGRKGGTCEETRWRTKENTKRNRSRKHGSVTIRGGISAALSNMEEDHRKCAPKHGRRLAIQTAVVCIYKAQGCMCHSPTTRTKKFTWFMYKFQYLQCSYAASGIKSCVYLPVTTFNILNIIFQSICDFPPNTSNCDWFWTRLPPYSSPKTVGTSVIHGWAPGKSAVRAATLWDSPVVSDGLVVVDGRQHTHVEEQLCEKLWSHVTHGAHDVVQANLHLSLAVLRPLVHPSVTSKQVYKYKQFQFWRNSKDASVNFKKLKSNG